MIRLVMLLLCAGVALASDIQLTEQEIEQLTKYMQDLEQQKLREASDYQPHSIIPARRSCTRDEQCPLTMSCIDIPSALFDVLKGADALQAYDFVRLSMGITGGECIEDFAEWVQNNATRYFPVIEGEIEKINNFVGKAVNEDHLTGVKFISKVDYEPIARKPIARAGAVYTDPAASDMMQMLPMLMLLQSGTNGLGGDNDMLMNLMLMNTMGGAGGSNMLNNPLLLLALASEDSSGDSDSLLQIILLSSMFDNQQGMGSVMPLFLISSLGDNSEISDILPLILMTNMFAPAGSAQDPISQLLPLILLNNGSNGDFLETFLMISLLGSFGGAGGIGLGQDILPLLLLFGGSNDSMTSDFLMPFILLNFFGASSGGADILPLLMLLQDGGLTGSSSGLDLKTLALILSMGNMGTGGIQNILPLLFLGDSSPSSSTDVSDLLLISVLGGQGMNGPAGDISNLLLPLLLGGDDIDSTMVVMLLLLSTQSAPMGPAPMPGTQVVHHVQPHHVSTIGLVPPQVGYPVDQEPVQPYYPEPAVQEPAVVYQEPVVYQQQTVEYQSQSTGDSVYKYPVQNSQPEVGMTYNTNQPGYQYPVQNAVRKRRSTYPAPAPANNFSQFLYIIIIKMLTEDSSSDDDNLMNLLLILMLTGQGMF